MIPIDQFIFVGWGETNVMLWVHQLFVWDGFEGFRKQTKIKIGRVDMVNGG